MNVRDRNLVNQKVWIGIVVGVLFVGIAGGYAVFLNAYQPEVMMTQTQIMQQLMMQSPEHRQQMMEAIIGDEEFMHEMTEMTSEHGTHEPMMGSMMEQSPMEEHEMMLGIMEGVMEDEEMRQHMMAHMMENQGFVHQMFTFMEQSPEMIQHMEAHVTGDVSMLEKFQSGE